MRTCSSMEDHFTSKLCAIKINYDFLLLINNSFWGGGLVFGFFLGGATSNNTQRLLLALYSPLVGSNAGMLGIRLRLDVCKASSLPSILFFRPLINNSCLRWGILKMRKKKSSCKKMPLGSSLALSNTFTPVCGKVRTLILIANAESPCGLFSSVYLFISTVFQPVFI